MISYFIYMGWVQLTPSVTLNNVTPPNNLLYNSYFENLIVELHDMFYMFLTFMLIFMSIGCYLLFDP